MDENIYLLELALRELQAARRRTGSKKLRTYLRLAIAQLNQLHHNLTT